MKIFNLIFQLFAIIGAIIIMINGDYIFSLLLLILVAILGIIDNMEETNERLKRLEKLIFCSNLIRSKEKWINKEDLEDAAEDN